MNKTLITIALLIMIYPVSIYAQTIPKTMNIYEKNGTLTKIPLDRIEKITFDGPQIGYNDNVVRDGDGNIYQTVKIGHQVWLASNLRTTKYNDGTPIQNITVGADWIKARTGAYSWYMNNSDNKEVYGALYNWYAVAEDKICPKGFHVPRKEEWSALILYAGSGDAGAKLKSTGNDFWKNNKYESNNSTGFTALPGGVRQQNGAFHFEGTYSRWWTAEKGNDDSGEGVNIYNDSNLVPIMGSRKIEGSYVRCIRD